MQLVIKVRVKTIKEAFEVSEKFLRKVAYDDMTDSEYQYITDKIGGVNLFPMTLDYKESFDAGIDLLLEE